MNLMYYPYLRAKTEEINCLLQVNPQIYSNTIPIIEPIGLSKTNLRMITKLVDNNISFIFIVNPEVAIITFQQILDFYLNGVFANYTNYSIAYIVNNHTNDSDLRRFNALNFTKSLIHKSTYPNLQFINTLVIERHIFRENFVTQAYINSINSINKIKLIDGFAKQKRNADYPNQSLFSDLHFTYAAENLNGVSDYVIQGDNFSERGGPASAVAIHFTKIINNQVIILHFLSDNITGQGRTPEKYRESLVKLINHLNNNPQIFRTTGIEDYQSSFATGHFPGLPANKRFALKNHIEQVSNII